MLYQEIDEALVYPIKHDPDSPVREYKTFIDEAKGVWHTNRLMIGTAVTGLVRVEWVAARYGQTIPMNWSYVYVNQFLNTFMPLGYQVADAQNKVVKEFIERDFEWLLLHEHDVILPPDTWLKLNEYMLREDTPVVSGLYYNRGRPSYPLVFRGRGTSIYTKWKMGDLVWCDGVPTGCLLIHGSILREMWQDAPEYELHGDTVRRVFNTPTFQWYDTENQLDMATMSGTSDLHWCSAVIDGGYFKKAGWPKYQRKKYPFVVDTNIFCRHINPDGEQFP